LSWQTINHQLKNGASKKLPRRFNVLTHLSLGDHPVVTAMDNHDLILKPMVTWGSTILRNIEKETSHLK
jgi:hypothetical protein